MSSNQTNDSAKKEEAIIQNIQTGQNRAFYGSKNVHFKNITIDGIEQGEGAFAECRNITIEDTHIFLDYSLWHCYNISLYKIILEPKTRSSIWNCQNIEIVNCKINTVKACRDCSNITLKDCIINSEDFGWKCKGIKIINCKISGITPFFDNSNVIVEGTEFNAKYMFQYSDNIKMLNSTIDSKDCFWHAKNVYCKNCKFVGIYLGWFSENCIFENCHIDSVMAFCYCKKLKLINCTMSNCDWGFEYSEVDGDIKGHVDSIRNVLSGKIVVDSIGEYIQADQVKECKGIVEIRPKEEEEEKK